MTDPAVTAHPLQPRPVVLNKCLCASLVSIIDLRNRFQPSTRQAWGELRRPMPRLGPLRHDGSVSGTAFVSILVHARLDIGEAVAFWSDHHALKARARTPIHKTNIVVLQTVGNDYHDLKVTEVLPKAASRPITEGNEG